MKAINISKRYTIEFDLNDCPDSCTIWEVGADGEVINTKPFKPSRMKGIVLDLELLDAGELITRSPFKSRIYHDPQSITKHY